MTATAKKTSVVKPKSANSNARRVSSTAKQAAIAGDGNNNVAAQSMLDVLELTSDDDDGLDAASRQPTQIIKSDVSDSKPDIAVEAVDPNTVRTRSSNGITKKRMLKDAAILSEEDTPVPVTPKKSRLAGGAVGIPCNDGGEIYKSDMVFTDDATGLSLSPLKLGIVHDKGQGRDREVNDPFATETVLRKGLVLNRSKSAGKKKAVDVPAMDISEDEPLTDEIDLESEELMNIARAFMQSAKEQRLRDKTTSGASSAIIELSGVGHNDNDVDNVSVTSDRTDAGPRATIVKPVVAIAPSVSSPFPKPKRTFRDVFPQAKAVPIMTKSPLYQEDLMQFRISSLPTVCEVTDLNIQDEYLVSDYPSLPHLTSGRLVSWSTSSGEMAQISFSQWALQCPDMNFDVALDAIRFVRYKNFINPSRISPLDVNILYSTHDHKRSVLQCNMRTAVCLSLILTERDSSLLTPSTYGLKNKNIAGHFHTQEWQCFEGFATMVFDKPVMTAQIYNRALSFATMGSAKDRDSSFPSKGPRNSAIFSSKIRTGDVIEPSKTVIADAPFKSVLDYNDDVPIFDAREYPLNFGSDLDNIASVLPRLYKEIPANSCVVVGYSMAHYMKDNNAHLSTNVLFAVVLGTEYSM